MDRINIKDEDLDSVDKTHKWRESARFTHSVHWVCTVCRARMFKQRIPKLEDTYQVKKHNPHFSCNEMIIYNTMKD